MFRVYYPTNPEVDGKAVKIRCGPATVCGDESRTISLPAGSGWEEAAGRTIHEPGNLVGFSIEKQLNSKTERAFAVKAVWCPSDMLANRSSTDVSALNKPLPHLDFINGGMIWFAMHDMDVHMPMASRKTNYPLLGVPNIICTLVCMFAFITLHLLAVVPAHGTVKNVTDQLGRPVRLTTTPERIVALAPSITEIMFYLDLADRLVGATQFSDYPPEAATLPKVGSYIHLDVERIAALKPDLCIAVKDGNPISAIGKLESVGVPVYAVDPRNLEAVMKTLLELGRLLDVEDKAKALVNDMSRRIQKVRLRVSKISNKPSVFLQIGITPIVSVGTNTFIHELIVMAGGINLAQGPTPYPRFSKEQVIGLHPDVIIITSMARKATFDQVKAEWEKWNELPAAKNSRIHLVNSDVFDRATPRLVDALELLAHLIHPECFDDTMTEVQP